MVMTYTREELDWIEAEWAFHLHGRSAFLSREDFTQLLEWSGEGIAADALVGAMEAYFDRRAKRPKPRSFVALAHLAKDVARVVKLREALRRAEPGVPALEGWDSVLEPLRSDPRARTCFEAWRRLQATAPLPDAPGFLDHFDAERKALGELVKLAEAALGPQGEEVGRGLRQRLLESKLQEGSFVWKRAWEHHWARLVCEAWRIPA
jgi:hypothetical protein